MDIKNIMETKFKIKLEAETVDLIQKEIDSIPEKFQTKLNSNHEGFGVLYEEVLELQQELFWGEKNLKEKEHKERIREEAVQVAAMAIRIIQELT
jgi:hypothetical protein